MQRSTKEVAWLILGEEEEEEVPAAAELDAIDSMIKVYGDWCEDLIA